MRYPKVFVLWSRAVSDKKESRKGGIREIERAKRLEKGKIVTLGSIDALLLFLEISAH